MNLLMRIIKITFLSYLIYVFIFSLLIFGFHKTSSKEVLIDSTTQSYPHNNRNDRVALVESPEDGVSVRLSLIENAKSSIDLAYYKLVDGQISEIILASILDAADRGVKVRILLDGFIQLINMGGNVDQIFLGFETHPNIEIKLYEPFNPLLPISWNNRLHDKMILVDGKLALIGGRNIEDRFYLRESYGDGFVEDRDVLIYHDKPKLDITSSSVVDEIQEYYEVLWQDKYSKAKYKYMNKKRIKKGEIALLELKSKHKTFIAEYKKSYYKDIGMINWKEATLPTNAIYFVSNPIGRTNQDPRCLKAILQLTSQAKDSIFIQSPYIINSRAIRSLYRQYDIELEDITLLTNSKASSPNVLAISAYENHKEKMIDKRISIYEYQGPGSIHAKTSIFDEQISVVGTFNIDPRSSYINTESMVIIDCKVFANNLKQEVQENLASSLRIDQDYNYIEKDDLSPSPLPKSKIRMIRIFSKIVPLIEHLL